MSSMPIKFKKDTRNKFWPTIEKAIQERAVHKDKKLKLKGPWKKFIGKEEGFKIYAVDNSYVKTNLSVIFGHGGHGYVHEFIPRDEIWVSTHHYDTCRCKKISPLQKVSQNFFISTMIHEITEYKEMKRGRIYWQAHQLALQKEKEIGLLRSPFSDLPDKKIRKQSVI
jgi:hypothetical protein